MTGLEVVRKVEPSYPTLARLSRIQGTVVLLMTVDEAGLPTQVQVLEGHAALQDAAVRAARQWRFVPARLEGRPVVASFRLTLKFALR
jgi:protein TonB